MCIDEKLIYARESPTALWKFHTVVMNTCFKHCVLVVGLHIIFLAGCIGTDSINDLEIPTKDVREYFSVTVVVELIIIIEGQSDVRVEACDGNWRLIVSKSCGCQLN